MKRRTVGRKLGVTCKTTMLLRAQSLNIILQLHVILREPRGIPMATAAYKILKSIESIFGHHIRKA